MSDLISKKSVMEELLAIQDATYMSTCLTVDECKGKRWMIARAIDAVKDTPTVDAEPVRHGRWLDNELSYAEDRHQAMTCSVCHKYSYRPVGEYCRWCGAKMDEEVEE